ncbi:MAG: hypothetical protein SNJ75_19460, partial [Gemmataceae bacterium]
TVTIHGSSSNFTLGTTGVGFVHGDQLGDIASLRIVGSSSNLRITSTGRLNTLTLGSVSNSTLAARTIGTLRTVAHAAAGSTGDWFESDLQLQGGSSTSLALGSASIAGQITGTGFGQGSRWDIQGRTGPIRIAGGVSGWTLGTTIAQGGVFPDQLGAIAALRVAGALAEMSINSVGRIGIFSAATIDSLILRANSLGVMTVGTATAPGKLSNSSLSLSGAFGTAGNALDNLTVHGPVRDTRIDVLAGNVGSVTVGRFEASKLYLGYTPGLDFETLGTFTSTPYTLNRFVTTQAFTANLPQTLAFGNSEVVAHRFGTVRLSGVLTGNSGVAFGLRVNGPANSGSVRVAAPTTTFLPTANLLPNVSFGDFHFVAS